MTRYAAIALFALALTLTGCQKGNDDPTSGGSSSESAAAVGSEKAPSESAAASPSASAEKDDLPVGAYVEAIQGDPEGEVVLSELADMDLDGTKEAVIGFGSKNADLGRTDITSIFLLREENGEIKQLGDNLANGGYAVYDARLIKLQDSPNAYLYLGLTNDGPMKGFAIYELKNGMPEVLVYSASATGSGDDELFDDEQDGAYNGYAVFRDSYDVFYNPVSSNYEWDGHEFQSAGAIVELPAYPDNPKDVVTQYISLRLLEDWQAQEVSTRLSEMCTDDKAGEKKFAWEDWSMPIANELMVIEGDLAYKMDVNGDKATATVEVKGDGKSGISAKFRLSKHDGKWIVNEVR